VARGAQTRFQLAVVAAATSPRPAAALVPSDRQGAQAATGGIAGGAARQGPAAGWLAIEAPLPLEVRERGEIVGTSASNRIMLPAGTREFELAAPEYGFAERRRLTISPGQTTRLTIAPPEVPVHINATPWAEVWIEGRRIGETPIGTYRHAIGAFEIEFRHPSLGTRRVPVVASLGSPARVAVDMRTP
jgi:hypothetical protein